MARIKWDDVGKKEIHYGVSQGVIYPQDENGTYPEGEAWNGLSEVNINPSGAESNDIYADNIKYASLLSAEDCGGTISSYTYPDSFAACNGELEVGDGSGMYASQQDRQPFGFCYRTEIGRDTKKKDTDYELHLIYGAKTKPSQVSNKTINTSVEADPFSNEFSTTPVPVPNMKPSAHITLRPNDCANPEYFKALEDVLYGTESTDPRLPLPEEVARILTTGQPAA